MADSEIKMQDLLDKLVEESEKTKKTYSNAISKRSRSRCVLRIGNIKIKPLITFKYIGKILTEDGECDT